MSNTSTLPQSTVNPFRLIETILTWVNITKRLAKSGIVFLVLISVLSGFLIGSPVDTGVNFIDLGLTLFGILFLAGGASALNQVQEVEIDSRMNRTKNRPIPNGEITKRNAAILSVGSIIAGTLIVGFVDWQLMILGVLAVVFYNGLYTMWWKKKMAFAAIPGAIPGALPILMGYVAASHSLFDPAGYYLFLILFVWQMPHFWVLAIRYKDDYKSGGIPTLPVARGDKTTLQHICIWQIAYILSALIAPLFLPVGIPYVLFSIVTGGYLLYLTHLYVMKSPEKNWLKFFLGVNFSLIGYLTVLVLDVWRNSFIALH